MQASAGQSPRVLGEDYLQAKLQVNVHMRLVAWPVDIEALKFKGEYFLTPTAAIACRCIMSVRRRISFPTSAKTGYSRCFLPQHVTHVRATVCTLKELATHA